MKRTDTINIELPGTVDVFSIAPKLAKIEGIKSVSLVTCQQLRVRYDVRKIKSKTILLTTGGKVSPN